MRFPSAPLPPPPTRAAVIAMTSDSNFMTLGHMSACSGFAIEYIEKALFNRFKCSCHKIDR